MTRVTKPDRARLAIRSANHEQGQIVIHGASGSAAIGGEPGAPDAPLEARGLQILRRRKRRRLHLADKEAGVAIDVGLVLGRDIDAEERGQRAAQHRRGVRV